MNLTLTTPVDPRSESLAFLSLSPSDLESMACNTRKTTPARSSARVGHQSPFPTAEDKARVALVALIVSFAESQSPDEFIARRDRLFPQYVDLMLGLGRIVHALTDRAEVTTKVKIQIEHAKHFFSDAPEQFCPRQLKDQVMFCLWELGKVWDLADFIHSRPPLPVEKREEDSRLSATCTVELLMGRMHLDCLSYAIAKKRVFPEDMTECLSEGLRHIVNGHIAIRMGARLRQAAVEDEPIAAIPLDEEDRLHLSQVMECQEQYDY